MESFKKYTPATTEMLQNSAVCKQIKIIVA